MGELIKRLKNEILLGDGAMGTLLYSHGRQSCFEELNCSMPEKIIGIHRQYIEAGAQIIQTNTYGANEGKLRFYGLEDKVKEINRAAVRNARAAVTNKELVMGTIGGVRHVGGVKFSKIEWEMALLEQVDVLLEHGVDGLLLETFYDEEELFQAVKAIKDRYEIDIIAQISFQEIGIMQSGRAIEDVLTALQNLGADVVGMNCRLGPLHMIESLKYVPLMEQAYLSAYPNASMPKYVDGVYQYMGETDYFEEMAKEFVSQGVRLIGGCCGTTPAYISALQKGLKGVGIVEKKSIKKREDRKKIIIQPILQQDLVKKVKKERTVIVELDPPKTLSIRPFLEGAKALKQAGATAITMADNSLASPRVSNLALGSMLQRKDIPVIAHLTCRDRNLIGLQSHLLGLSTVGIHQVLAITGDPARIGDFPGATSVYDLSSIELIRLIKGMNEGQMFSGKQLTTPTSYQIGAAFNPNVRHIDAAVKRLERKVEAGADYFLTQPIYDIDTLIKTYEATKHIDQPIFIGVMPLVSKRNADYLHYEVPGITLSDEVRKRMDGNLSPEEAVKEGISIASELLDIAMKYFNGIYLVTPFLRYEITVELLSYIRLKEEKEVVK